MNEQRLATSGTLHGSIPLSTSGWWVSTHKTCAPSALEHQFESYPFPASPGACANAAPDLELSSTTLFLGGWGRHVELMKSQCPYGQGLPGAD